MKLRVDEGHIICNCAGSVCGSVRLLSSRSVACGWVSQDAVHCVEILMRVGTIVRVVCCFGIRGKLVEGSVHASR